YSRFSSGNRSTGALGGVRLPLRQGAGLNFESRIRCRTQTHLRRLRAALLLQAWLHHRTESTQLSLKDNVEPDSQSWGIVGGGMLGMTLGLRPAQPGSLVSFIEYASQLGSLSI